MTRVFQVGDIVRIRPHSASEKRLYPLNWNASMDDWEDLCGIVVSAHKKDTNDGENRYILMPCAEDYTIKPGDDFRVLTDGSRRQMFSFVESSLSLKRLSPWRSIPVGEEPLPLVGEWDEATTKRFVSAINWTSTGVTINGVTVLPSCIPHANLFTTF